MELLTNININWTDVHTYVYIVFPTLLMIFDIITGWIGAWINNDLKSSKMRTGLGKKCAELVYIAVGFMFRVMLGINPILYFVVFYVCLMEFVSIIENCDKLGFKIPKLTEKINNEVEKLNK